MRNPRRKTDISVLPNAIALVMGGALGWSLFSGCGSKSVEEGPCPVKVHLEARADTGSADILLTYRVENQSMGGVWIFKCDTPLEGSLSEGFIVTCDGRKAQYKGWGGVMRGAAPKGRDWVYVGPGESVQETVSVAERFDIVKAEVYVIECRAILCYRSKAPKGDEEEAWASGFCDLRAVRVELDLRDHGVPGKP